MYTQIIKDSFCAQARPCNTPGFQCCGKCSSIYRRFVQEKALAGGRAPDCRDFPAGRHGIGTPGNPHNRWQQVQPAAVKRKLLRAAMLSEKGQELLPLAADPFPDGETFGNTPPHEPLGDARSGPNSRRGCSPTPGLGTGPPWPARRSLGEPLNRHPALPPRPNPTCHAGRRNMPPRLRREKQG